MNRRNILLFLALLFLAGCASPPPYVYQYIPGQTAYISNGYAVAPAAAPPEVRIAIAAGNRISVLPYAYGAGHSRAEFESAYDCSGATSFVLKAAGLQDESMPAAAFRHFGDRGPGEWITIYAGRNHVFLVVAGLRFDTGWNGHRHGPRWTEGSRPADGMVIRHPYGW